MQATSISSKFFRVSQAAKYLGVSTSQIRLLCKSGELCSARSAGNHRLVEVASLLAYCGEDSLEDNGNFKVAIVSRCSTQKQSADLERQKNKLEGYAKEHYPQAEIVHYSRIGSAMNYADETFNRLVKDILAGMYKGGIILATFPDRVLRWGIELFRTIATSGGCEIVFIGEGEEDKSDNQSLADDILAILTVFSARKHGSRSKALCELTLTPECISRMGELKKQNLPNKAIWEVIVSEGWLNNHGEKPSYFTICKYLRDSHNFNTAVGILEEDMGLGLFKEFLKRNCTRKIDGRMPLTELCKAYDAYCLQNGKATSPRWLIGQHLSALQVKRVKSNGSRFACGIVLKGNKLAS